MELTKLIHMNKAYYHVTCPIEGNEHTEELVRIFADSTCRIKIGSGTNLYNCAIHLTDGASLEIGDNCDLNSLVISACGEGSSIKIGDGVKTCIGSPEYSEIICGKGDTVFIGSGCRIDGGVIMRTFNDMTDETASQKAGLIIGDSSKIGRRVELQGDMTLKKNSVATLKTTVTIINVATDGKNGFQTQKEQEAYGRV